MNAERDRDRQLEQLLKHELGAATAAPASAACLDAETVAAWMEGGLNPQAAALAEAHASGCERCQALLATVARTTPAAAAADAKGARLWRWWFAPLAASAAAATLWMVVPRGPTTIPESAPKQVVEAQIPESAKDAAAPAPAASAPAAPVPASPAPTAPTVAREMVSERATAPAGTAQETARKAEAPMRADNAAEGRVGAAAPAPPALAQLRREQRVIEVASPDVTHRWRAGAGGTVEYSTDAAATWLPASSPAGLEITAGSSPSATVCWLVGRGGLVLVSGDGRTFTRAPFSEVTDLSSVTAVNARTATVTSADGRTFATDDGGRTWRRP
ncbi:MAG: hypothetical protein WC815_07275 [Vicinamibacterales bacterium]